MESEEDIVLLSPKRLRIVIAKELYPAEGV
jgi:hypothetical protein